MIFKWEPAYHVVICEMKVTNQGWIVKKWAVSQVEKYDSAERIMTHFWHPMWGSKRNQARQLADVDADVDSHRKTEGKKPYSKEKGHRGVLDKPTQRGRTKGLHQWTMEIIVEGIDDSATWSTSHKVRGSMSSWLLLSYLQVLKYYYWFPLAINTISLYSNCIGSFRVILREIL